MTIGNAVSKRIYVTLPDAVHADLERWAKNQGRTTANLAAFLIEVGIDQSKEEGKFPEQNNKRGDRP